VAASVRPEPTATMNSDLALQMMADLFRTGLVVSLPVLAATMLVGLLVGVLQVVTQVQEITLSFVPKLLAAVACLVVLGPWLLRQLAQFAARLWSSIPSMF
jgi:flagellar biosynthetic protein FliQ